MNKNFYSTPYVEIMYASNSTVLQASVEISDNWEPVNEGELY